MWEAETPGPTSAWCPLLHNHAECDDPLLNIPQYDVNRLHRSVGLLRKHDSQVGGIGNGLGDRATPQVSHRHANRQHDRGQQQAASDCQGSPMARPASEAGVREFRDAAGSDWHHPPCIGRRCLIMY